MAEVDDSPARGHRTDRSGEWSDVVDRLDRMERKIDRFTNTQGEAATTVAVLTERVRGLEVKASASEEEARQIRVGYRLALIAAVLSPLVCIVIKYH